MTIPKNNPGYIDIGYLESVGKLASRLKQRTYQLMEVGTGQKVLALGCGSATDTVPLAHLVGPTGQVVGVDYDPDMVAAANAKATQEGVAAWVRHEHADGASLPFEADCFDSARSDRVFQHLPQPEQVLAEMIRVTKPGGWIVVHDPDWSTLSIDTSLVDIEWRLRRYRADSRLNGYSGRKLWRQFKLQNLRDIKLETYPFHFTDYAQTRFVCLA